MKKKAKKKRTAANKAKGGKAKSQKPYFGKLKVTSFSDFSGVFVHAGQR